MRLVFLLLISYSTLIDGKCQFDKQDSMSENAENLIKKWSIYEKNFSLATNDSHYNIGICVPAVSSSTVGAAKIKDNSTIILGKIDFAHVVYGDGWLLLTYENGDVYENQCGNSSRKASLMFVCRNERTNPIVTQEDTEKEAHCHFYFEIGVPELCKQNSETKKISGFTIFLIVLLCLIVVYFVGGFFFLHFKRGARGFDRIPNFPVWQRIGNLAADGCSYCCRCPSRPERTGYLLTESDPEVNGDDDILAP